MLEGCKNLKEIDLGENKIKNAHMCFVDCEKLENVNLENVNLIENADLSNMFHNCKSIKNIQGIEKLVKKNDKAEATMMFEGAIVDGDLDLSQWGNKILGDSMFLNSKVKALKLFNLKEVLEYYREYCNDVIKNKEKLINDCKKAIEDYQKKFEKLSNKEPKTEKDIEDIKNTKENIKLSRNEIRKSERAIKRLQNNINDPHLNILTNAEVDELYINEEFMPKKKDLDGVVGDNCTVKILYVVDKDGNQKRYEGFDDYKNNINDPHLNILTNAEVDDLYINEEFMPKKEDLDRVLGNNCTVKMLYIVDKDGNYKKYEGFDNYKNGIEYKDPKPIDSENQQQDEKIEPIENNNELEKINKNQYCFQCLKCCCLCCPNNNNLLGKKTNRE